ncbi:MAG: tetratricopeptide repeat protein, partial [Candidatus Hodarchaeales archaeon]
TYNFEGEYDEAIAAYKQAIKINPNYTEAHYNLGSTYDKLGMHKEAIEVYKQVIEIKPDYVEAYYNLCLSYLILGDKDSAFREYKILKNLDPQKANNLYKDAIFRNALDIDKIDKLVIDNKHPSRTIYTIQTGSFIKFASAQNQFKSIIQNLDKKELDHLRIEKIGKFHAVRLGKFEKYDITEQFHQIIKPRLPAAVILKAYFLDDRIMRSYDDEKPIY